MSFSDQLHVVVQIREPLDKEEWMRRVGRTLLSSSNSKYKADNKIKIKKTINEGK